MKNYGTIDLDEDVKKKERTLTKEKMHQYLDQYLTNSSSSAGMQSSRHPHCIRAGTNENKHSRLINKLNTH